MVRITRKTGQAPVVPPEPPEIISDLNWPEPDPNSSKPAATAAPSKPTLSAAAARWVDDWQELLIWAPVLLAALLGLLVAIPLIDPRSGIDGIGGLFTLVGQLIVLAAIVFCAWLIKRTYLRSLSDEAEDELLARAQAGDLTALIRYLVDRIEWLAVLTLAWLVLA